MVRIASLLPSATEIVAALGFQDALVARSHECDFPAGVDRLPHCTAPKIALTGDSAEIDRRIKSVVEQGLSVYRVDSEQLKSLRPDLIVTQSQCDVCAVSEIELRSALEDWLEGVPRIVSLHPESLADIWRDIGAVAASLDVTDRGADLVQGLKERMAAIAARASALPARPRVACIEWIDPLMAGGNWMPELVAMAGGQNLFAEPGKHSPWLSWDAVVDADPEVIVILPCGFGMARARAEMPPLTARREWPELRAVRDGRVYIADGHHFFNRPGPRIAESLEILAEMVHPAEFDFGHEGIGWAPL
jgi:iron complex transport system substrate-binding protein